VYSFLLYAYGFVYPELHRSLLIMSKRLQLLMFALLRSTAFSIRQATTTTSILLRLATRTDVPAIQRCNLACLPENYNTHFYCSHLRQWPDLAVVAEEVSHFRSKETPEERQQQSRAFPGGQSEPKIVAYVLGKVETRPLIDFKDPTSCNDRVERLGHVTSLAVQKDFRRLGLAKAMMTQLHHHLQHHGIASCGLHVRTSNLAACRLYQEDGYEIDQVIKSYYQDGEDAYFMRRIFHQESRIDRPSRFGKKVWKSGPEALRLPRTHGRSIEHHDDHSGGPSGVTGSPPSAELLGTI